MLTKELLGQIEAYLAKNLFKPAPEPKQSRNTFHAAKMSYRYSPAKLEKKLQQIEETFPQYLLKYIAERGLNEIDLYKKAHLDRRIFSKLRTKKDYMPRKRTILAITLAMELNLDEAQKILSKGGYMLSPIKKEDVIISFFFENQIYDLFLVNEVLDNYGFKPL